MYKPRIFRIQHPCTPAPPHVLLYIYGVYGAVTCVSLMAGGEYQKLLLYVNSEGKKISREGFEYKNRNIKKGRTRF